MFFPSLAHAMGAAPSGGEGASNPITAFLPLILMFRGGGGGGGAALFYFLPHRPSRKKAKQHRGGILGQSQADGTYPGPAAGIYAGITEGPAVDKIVRWRSGPRSSSSNINRKLRRPVLVTPLRPRARPKAKDKSKDKELTSSGATRQDATERGCPGRTVPSFLALSPEAQASQMELAGPCLQTCGWGPQFTWLAFVGLILHLLPSIDRSNHSPWSANSWRDDVNQSRSRPRRHSI